VSALSKVMLWAVRVNSYNKEAAAHQILEIRADATLDDAQKAFHEIARNAHPDLHRSTLSAEDLETVTAAYARAAGAYQDIRTARTSTARLKPFDKTPGGGIPRMPFDKAPPTDKVPTPMGGLPRQPSEKVPTPMGGIPRIDPGGKPTGTGANQMSSKALIYYRKAELSLRRGDLKGAVLQVKMAIAADPQSAFLRSALVEIEAEIAKST
jgi:hypothetical protein